MAIYLLDTTTPRRLFSYVAGLYEAGWMQPLPRVASKACGGSI